MKLAKALKEKNRLAGEVNRLKNLICRENSRNVNSKSQVDVSKLWEEMVTVTDKLVAVKTAIFRANVGIYDKIVRIGELKGRAAWIVTIPTNNEKTEQPNYGGGVIVTEMKAWMTQESVDSTTKQLQDEIAKLQDEIDEYNATVTVEI